MNNTALNEFSVKDLKNKAKSAIDKVKAKFSKPKKEFDDTKNFTKDDIVDKVKKNE